LKKIKGFSLRKMKIKIYLERISIIEHLLDVASTEIVISERNTRVSDGIIIVWFDVFQT
jgi:hypothetical protein